MAKYDRSQSWLNNKQFQDLSYYQYIDNIHMNWLDIEAREMYMHGEWTSPELNDDREPGVEYNMTAKIIKNLHILRQSDPNEPVTIHMKTCGGDVIEGLALYDTIKLMPYKVKIINYTHARSMSSYIFQAADERIMLPHSYFLFHKGWEAHAGHPNEIRSGIEFTDKVHEVQLMKIYTDSMKKSKKFKGKSNKQLDKILTDLMNEKIDVYLTPEEAIEWGFADGILLHF